MTEPAILLQNALTPVLSLEDEGAGIALLKRVFRFEVVGSSGGFGTMLRLGDQSILVTPKLSIVGAYQPHHLALSVPDTDDAMKMCLERGGVLAQSMTPEGPLEIPEFWSAGVRYVFFEGPEGALIEFCTKKGERAEASWGHDHIGIQCSDIAVSKAQFETAGCELVAQHALDRDDGITDVVFLRCGVSVAELFSPPGWDGSLQTPPKAGWVGCLNL